MADALWDLGNVARARQEYAAAGAHYADSAARYRAVGVAALSALPLLCQAEMAHVTGDGTGAARLWQEGLTAWAQAPITAATAQFWLLGQLVSLAAVGARPMAPGRALAVAGAMARARASGKRVRPIWDATAWERHLHAIRRVLEAPVASAAWAAGQAMTLEQAVAYALAEAPDAPDSA